MKKGFTFNQSLCVNCKACSAACTLENHFTVKARNVLTYNRDASLLFPLMHLSIACNHCETPLCMKGCPASVYRIDNLTGSVIVDETRCIGCRYCIWNCPFDAPKYDPVNRVIGKCHFCYSRLEEGLDPACTSGCPTGALSYCDDPESDQSEAPPWFPGMELAPAFKFRAPAVRIPLKIVPSSLFRNNMDTVEAPEKTPGREWSLILFTFIAMISVSILASSLIISKLPDRLLLVSLLIVPGVLSFFHLGKWYRAWRALSNIKTSPLSREIAVYILYMAVSIAAVFHSIPWLLISATVTGILLLLTIDAVYLYPPGDPKLHLHSGQTFISALLIISYLTLSLWPFIFIAAIKTVLSIIQYKPVRNRSDIFRHLRVALLLVTTAGMINGISDSYLPVTIVFFTGELLDRMLFYYDFDPVNINKLITRHISEGKYER